MYHARVEWVLAAVVIVVGGLGLWSLFIVDRSISKVIQPRIDDFFGSYPKQGNPPKKEDDSAQAAAQVR